ncbi:MAG: methyltransferase domain-containing protein, partial [Geminicoccaceae bacterium]
TILKHQPIRSVLDYGCGKGTLGEGFRRRYPFCRFAEYDPVTRPDWPDPADLVVCVDVLEHIAPEYLEKVLDHLSELTLRAGFLAIATRPANKTLPDGRNAHLIIESNEWWQSKIAEHFHIESMETWPGDIEMVVTPS